MIKIKFVPTGHVFLIPDEDAMILKEKSPDEYEIIEKDGKKVKTSSKKKTLVQKNSTILDLVLDVEDDKPKRRRKK